MLRWHLQISRCPWYTVYTLEHPVLALTVERLHSSPRWGTLRLCCTWWRASQYRRSQWRDKPSLRAPASTEVSGSRCWTRNLQSEPEKHKMKISKICSIYSAICKYISSKRRGNVLKFWSRYWSGWIGLSVSKPNPAQEIFLSVHVFIYLCKY